MELTGGHIKGFWPSSSGTQNKVYIRCWEKQNPTFQNMNRIVRNLQVLMFQVKGKSMHNDSICKCTLFSDSSASFPMNFCHIRLISLSSKMPSLSRRSHDFKSTALY